MIRRNPRRALRRRVCPYSHLPLAPETPEELAEAVFGRDLSSILGLLTSNPGLKLAGESPWKVAQLTRYLWACRDLRLDPWIGPLQFGFGRPWETTLEGARLIAERTGRLVLIEEPRFGHPDPREAEVTATVSIVVDRDGEPATYSGAFMDGEPKLPRSPAERALPPMTLAARSAERTALRKAFPELALVAITLEEA